MQFNYEKLDLTPSIHELIAKTYALTIHFPDNEKYGLSSQVRRASVSVLLNLAEGSARRSNKEFARFIKIACGSIVEVDASLKLAVTLGYITEEKRELIDNLIEKVYYPLISLRKSLE